MAYRRENRPQGTRSARPPLQRLVFRRQFYLQLARILVRRVGRGQRDVFVATTSYGRTFALDARTGKRLWTFNPPSLHDLEGSAQITHSSPIADPGRKFVYAASPDGRIRKLRLRDGRQVTSRAWPAVITRLPEREKIGTALNISGSHVLAVLIFLLAYRVFQDYMLSPHLMGQGVEVHPLLVLFGVFAGAEIAGVAGTFLSVPVLALVRILYLRIRKQRLATRVTPEHTLTI